MPLLDQQVHVKACPVVGIKAGTADGLEEGQFEALVSVFGNKDSYGDVVVPGAFKRTLEEWAAKGSPIPVVWSHMYQDPDYHIGFVVDAAERAVAGGKSGLWVRGQLDLDPDARKALQVNRLLKGRRVTQFSFSYGIKAGGFAQSDELGEYYELRDLDLYEVGPTLIGANQDTELLAAKAAHDLAVQIKAGRVLSASNEGRLRTAYDAIGEVLSALDGEGKAAPPSVPGTAEDPARGKADGPRRIDPTELAMLDLALRV